MARWLGIDHGTRRIGVAVGSTDAAVASPVEVLPAAPAEQVTRRIVQLAEEYAAYGVVVGWPLNMDDSEGPQGRLARAMAAGLAEATALDVRLWDERLSSFAADQALAGSYTRKQKRARQDAVAAAAILQDFLASDGPASAPRPADVPEDAD
jgi:putative Holliday junction resolvase